MRTLLLILLLGITAVPQAFAQTKIIAVVNDDVISDLDLEQRIRFIAATSRLNTADKEVRRQILKQLIDEKLKQQEARRAGVSATERELKHAIDSTLKQNGMDAEQMASLLKEANLPASILEDQIKSDLLFIKALRKNVSQRAEISDAEVNARMEEITNQVNEKQYLLSEIFLPVEDDSKDAETYGKAVQIVMKLREGEPFEKLAQTYSHSASASAGGLLGWVGESGLEKEVKSELSLIQPGQITTPIKTKIGYMILAVRSTRSPEDMKEQDAYHLAQIFIPDSMANEKPRLMKSIALTKGSCQQFIDFALQLKTAPQIDLGKIPVNEIPPPILNLVEKGTLLQPTDSLPIDGGELIFMPCSKEKISPLPTKEEIKMQIETKRLEMTAQRRLRELRRSAITEIRI